MANYIIYEKIILLTMPFACVLWRVRSDQAWNATFPDFKD